MACINLFFILLISLAVKADNDLEYFELDQEPGETLIAQESRLYHTFVKPPVRIVKPNGITNSHRPQYNLDSFEEEIEEILETTTKRNIGKDYKTTLKLRAKEGMIRDAVLRALERKDHVGKFAQIIPIVRAMSGSQRVALASLVANQVTTPPGRTPLNLSQVRSMFGDNQNTTAELMLPILLDMANLIRKAVRSGKEPREVKHPLSLQQIQRRSIVDVDNTFLDDEPFETQDKITSTQITKLQTQTNTAQVDRRRIRPQKDQNTQKNKTNSSDDDKKIPHNNDLKDTAQHNNRETSDKLITNDNTNTKNAIRFSASTEGSTQSTPKSKTSTSRTLDNSTTDLAADSTNTTLAQDLPVAEKLRVLNRFIDRKSNLIRRGSYPPKPATASRRTTAEPTLSPINRRRPVPSRKLQTVPAGDQAKCELFTNTLCLHDADYPTEAIVQSIRRNKAAAGALLADFKDPGEGAFDGITADQEAKYTSTAERRGDLANREFATAGEAGFMCPSTVKYARPQRARATSGQWKYIVNTGEHTQTLRLEKCLKPKESCTYLTDNFKSKCVQVYNYHRLLTWDQQNGLHMDIFKVPTCCSCHIEGYSVAFPPLGHRIQESSSEHFPGEDLSSDHGNHAFESVQSSILRPTVTKSPPFITKPIESFPPFTDNHNLITGNSFSNPKINDNEDYEAQPNPTDSYGNNYFPDSFNQGTSVKNIRRPVSGRNPASGLANSDTLSSYLEPPTPSAPASFSFAKDTPNKFKNTNQFKRGANRPNRRPIRKKIAGGPDDLMSSGTSASESFTNTNVETMEDYNGDLEEPEVNKVISSQNLSKRVTIAPKLHAVTTEKIASTHRPRGEIRKQHREDTSVNVNGKRVNYNYHPIIDFFEENDKENNRSIDREDISMMAYVSTPESEWKPINHPPSRNSQSTNTVGRKKH